jgi:hypothetical protein
MKRYAFGGCTATLVEVAAFPPEIKLAKALGCSVAELRRRVWRKTPFPRFTNRPTFE